MKFDPDIIRCIEIVDAGPAHRPTHASSLLVWYAKPGKGVKRVLELGSGIGTVSFALAKIYDVEVVGIEKERELYEKAVKGIYLNQLEGKVSFVNASVKEVSFEPESFDMVVSNPPHHTKVKSKHPLKASTRSLERTDIQAFVQATFRFLKNGGTAVYVLSPENFVEWLEEFVSHRLEPKRMCFVHGKIEKVATLVLLRLRKNGKRGLIVDPPVILS
ncbi:tRNA1(Val) (adenine(37)-N6)-methyltransferase [Thermotoga sp. KOL6]|uniref:tRNA1(Val) (adenine(37)-N6)-methyltransferase n=1 Tax=Thermotoga sp. KOL6 TaxID=126741 RepID=UPI000C75D581|nr:methyltransferase domain-containing protein [Thermotoga sp. KOL6]PLV59392.1 SAM-dependent methyltransferase [Thermotoga sp. KOL6]